MSVVGSGILDVGGAPDKSAAPSGNLFDVFRVNEQTETAARDRLPTIPPLWEG